MYTGGFFMGELAKRVIQSMQLDPTRGHRVQGHTGNAQEINNKDIICKTLEEINEGYESGALEWLRKNRPQVWQKSLTLEEDMNEAALRNDIEALRRVLTEYEDLMLSMVREFRAKGKRNRTYGNGKGEEGDKKQTP
jgi:hypothetical protein